MFSRTQIPIYHCILSSVCARLHSFQLASFFSLLCVWLMQKKNYDEKKMYENMLCDRIVNVWVPMRLIRWNISSIFIYKNIQFVCVCVFPIHKIMVGIFSVKSFSLTRTHSWEHCCGGRSAGARSRFHSRFISFVRSFVSWLVRSFGRSSSIFNCIATEYNAENLSS